MSAQVITGECPDYGKPDSEADNDSECSRTNSGPQLSEASRPDSHGNSYHEAECPPLVNARSNADAEGITGSIGLGEEPGNNRARTGSA